MRRYTIVKTETYEVVAPNSDHAMRMVEEGVAGARLADQDHEITWIEEEAV